MVINLCHMRANDGLCYNTAGRYIPQGRNKRVSNICNNLCLYFVNFASEIVALLACPVRAGVSGWCEMRKVSCGGLIWTQN